MIIDFKYDLGETVNVLEERKNSPYKTGVIIECFFNKDGKQYWVKRDCGISWFKENELKGRQAQGQQAQGEHNEDIKHIIKIDGLDESIAIIADPQSIFVNKKPIER